MGHGEEKPPPQVKFDNVDVSSAADGLSVRAEYSDVHGALWRSSLSLVWETLDEKVYLVNGEPKFERIAQRTIPEGVINDP